MVIVPFAMKTGHSRILSVRGNTRFDGWLVFRGRRVSRLVLFPFYFFPWLATVQLSHLVAFVFSVVLSVSCSSIDYWLLLL